jgi:hypothetical protein
MDVAAAGAGDRQRHELELEDEPMTDDDALRPHRREVRTLVLAAAALGLLALPADPTPELADPPELDPELRRHPPALPFGDSLRSRSRRACGSLSRSRVGVALVHEAARMHPARSAVGPFTPAWHRPPAPPAPSFCPDRCSCPHHAARQRKLARRAARARAAAAAARRP